MAHRLEIIHSRRPFLAAQAFGGDTGEAVPTATSASAEVVSHSWVSKQFGRT